MMKLNNKAFTLIETLMSALIISIAIMGVSLLTTLMSKSTVKLTNKNSFDSMKYDLVSSVFTPQAWRYTINNTSNPSLECFRKNTDCRGQGGAVNGKLVLYDASGAVFYNSTTSTTGFTKVGAVCNTFDQDSADANCPVRFNIYWEPICPPTGACIKPRIKVFGRAIQNQSPAFTNLSETEFKNFDLIPEEINDLAPVAVSDIFYVQAGGTLSNVDVLTNDKYIKSENVTIELQKTTSDYGATLSLSSDKKISAVYTSVPNFHGLDKFTYKIKREDDKYTVATVWVKVMHNYTWTGDKSDVWNDPGNWCGTVKADFTGCQGHTTKPTTTSVLYFDETCSSSFTCVPTTNENIEVNGVVIKENGFRQGSGFTIAIGRSLNLGQPLPATLPYGFHMTGGQFFGGNNKISINQGAPFNIAGGTFNSTSDVLELGRRHGNRASEVSGIELMKLGLQGNFVHNGGVLNISGPPDGACSHKYWFIETSKLLSLNRLTINMQDSCWTSTGGPQIISKTTPGTNGKIQIITSLNHVRGVLKGDWYLSGDLNVESGAIGYLRSYYANSEFGNIILNGASNQTYSNAAGGTTAFITVDKTSGIVQPSSSTTSLSAIGLNVKNGRFNAPNTILTLGTPADKNYDIVNIESTGTFSHNNGIVRFYAQGSGSCGHKTFSINSTASTLDFNGVEIDIHDTCWDSTGQAELVVTTGTIVNINSDLNYNRGVLKGIWNLKGNLTVANNELAVGYYRLGFSTLGEMATININGENNQYYEFGGEGKAPIVVVNKTSGAFLPKTGNNLFNATVLRVQQGSFSAPSSGTLEIGFRENFSLEILSVNPMANFNINNSLLKITNIASGSCGNKNWTINVPSNINFNDVTIDILGTCAHGKLIITNGTFLSINGNLTVKNGNLSGEFKIAGNIKIGPSSDAGGNGILAFIGNQNQNLSCIDDSGNTLSTCPNNFPGGEIKLEKVNPYSVFLNSSISLPVTTQNLNITSGTLSLNGHALSLGGTLTIGAQGTLDASISGSSYTPNASPRLINNGTIISQPMTSNTQ